MPHVDEGMLHAYLDGALDREEQLRMTRHLAECDACMSLLETERGIHDAAGSLLERDAGVPVTVPPFEEIRRRRAELADTANPRGGRPIFTVRRLSWAASIVLAVGIGWVARGSLIDRWGEERRGDATEQRAGLAQDVERDKAGTIIDSPITTRKAGRQISVEPKRTPTAPAPAELAEEQPKARVRAAAADRLNKMEEPAQKALEQTGSASRLQREAAAPRITTAMDAPAIAGELDDTRGFTDLSWSPITPAEARTLLGREPASIPTFPITFLASAIKDGQVTIRVDQEVTGDTISLYQSSAPLSPLRLRRDEAAGTGEAAAAVDVTRSGLTIHLTGKVSPDSLRNLARLIPRR